MSLGKGGTPTSFYVLQKRRSPSAESSDTSKEELSGGGWVDWPVRLWPRGAVWTGGVGWGGGEGALCISARSVLAFPVQRRHRRFTTRDTFLRVRNRAKDPLPSTGLPRWTGRGGSSSIRVRVHFPRVFRITYHVHDRPVCRGNNNDNSVQCDDMSGLLLPGYPYYTLRADGSRHSWFRADDGPGKERDRRTDRESERARQDKPPKRRRFIAICKLEARYDGGPFLVVWRNQIPTGHVRPQQVHESFWRTVVQPNYARPIR